MEAPVQGGAGEHPAEIENPGEHRASGGINPHLTATDSRGEQGPEGEPSLRLVSYGSVRGCSRARPDLPHGISPEACHRPPGRRCETETVQRRKHDTRPSIPTVPFPPSGAAATGLTASDRRCRGGAPSGPRSNPHPDGGTSVQPRQRGRNWSHDHRQPEPFRTLRPGGGDGEANGCRGIRGGRETRPRPSGPTSAGLGNDPAGSHDPPAVTSRSRPPVLMDGQADDAVSAAARTAP